MKRSEKISQFVEEIWRWYARHKRTLPWRDLRIADDTQRAYMILVSEVMLQQTQVPRVETAFPRFLRQFPTLADLARASNKEVIIAWQGMGYNSRALRLRDAARNVLEKFDGVFPREMDELQSLGGIGHYTAGAIRNFAFGIPTPCIDTNIRRILHRVFVGPESDDGTWKMNDRELLKIAGEVLEGAMERGDRRYRGHRRHRGGNKISSVSSVSSVPSVSYTTADWHAALMDFGSLVCKKSGVLVDICPLAKKNLYAGGPVIKAPKLTKPKKQEPGRLVGSTFIPNRIFRGRVVEQLRQSPSGMTLEQIGRNITVDWSTKEHRAWLQSLLEKLIADGLIASARQRFVLADI